MARQRRALDALLSRQQTLQPLTTAGEAQLRGDAGLLPRFFGLLDNVSGGFPVVDAARWPD
ncbi:alkyl sulfatase C-terminal domain-containing protein [Pseudacidovorax intermedius]|uniref:alkyl sulfatase C-terminal domain-containing protein n=1 Tax=Pseudacidovorax intermedius TaxID=433924 RepID=UPI00128F0719|nr:alkyl sulfatase C-terminal domain-containing protein [Pseudacidovorax intermedius]